MIYMYHESDGGFPQANDKYSILVSFQSTNMHVSPWQHTQTNSRTGTPMQFYDDTLFTSLFLLPPLTSRLSNFFHRSSRSFSFFFSLEEKIN